MAVPPELRGLEAAISVENLISHLFDFHAALASDGARRVVVAIAGSAGSGKSTLTRHLVRELSMLIPTCDVCSLSMDGWHQPKSVLAASPDPEFMFARRGAPFTFDSEAFASTVEALAASPPRAVPTLAFDHGRGDPEPGPTVPIPAPGRTQLVLVEGLYCLLRVPTWSRVAAAAHETVFVATGASEALERVVGRHMTAWNMSRERALERAAGNDKINSQFVIDNSAVDDAICVRFPHDPRFARQG
jgi:pantothenate kinase